MCVQLPDTPSPRFQHELLRDAAVAVQKLV